MKLKAVQQSVVPIGIAVGVVVAEQLSSWLRAWLTHAGVSMTFSVVVIVASAGLVKLLAATLFDRSRLLRRLLLRDQYLEGTWFDIMRVAGKPTEVGLSRLSYEDWEVKFTGEDYDLTGDPDDAGIGMAHRFPYTAEKAVYLKDNRLLYKYVAIRSDREAEVAGYGELQFHAGERGTPTRYSGHYYRPGGRGGFRKVSFEGFRLDERKDRDWLRRLDHPETRKEAIGQLLKRFGG